LVGNSWYKAACRAEAHEVLEALVEKYRLGGITDLDKPEVFNVPPFDHMGNIIGVAHRFGGVEELTGAVGELQRRVYVT
jgi:type I restriction enzyme R subunit